MFQQSMSIVTVQLRIELANRMSTQTAALTRGSSEVSSLPKHLILAQANRAE
jgi:hypothetical protein